jgi:hypothetical protein
MYRGVFPCFPPFSAAGKKFTICSLYSGIFLGYTINTEQMFEQTGGE